MTYRSKEKNMQLNPFKNQLIISSQEQVVEEQYLITSIADVEEIEDKSWLMSSKLQYFKLIIEGEEPLEVMFGVKNTKTYKKWI